MDMLSVDGMPTIVLPYWTGDRHQAERLLNWIKELGGTSFPIMLMASKEADPDGLLPLARECNPESFIEYDYENIKTDWHVQRTEKDPVRSARGPNSLFQQAARYFHDWTGKGNGKGDFLYLEPDSVVIRAGWDVALFEEYQRAGKPFMGALVPAGDGYPEHMSGVAVWSEQTTGLSQGVMRCDHGAFDVVGAEDIVPRAHFTTSIVHKFWHPGFKTQEEVSEWIKHDTLIFHANKDGSLIPFLRERHTITGASVTAALIKEAETIGIKEFKEFYAPPVVKTYYEKLEGRNHTEQEWLLGTWADSWRQHGWHPVVINHELAKSHPYYQHFLKSYMELPSVNSKEYEMACYIRHVAMVQSGGGLLVDYDVINVGYTPDMLPKSNGKYPAILADKNPCPCGVYGSAEEYDSLCSFFARQGKEAIVSEGGRPHTSDQHFVQHFASHFFSYEHIWQYGQKDWEKAKLIHFSSGSCQGRPRSEVIPSAIEMVQALRVDKFLKDELTKSIRDPDRGITKGAFDGPAPVSNGHKHTWIGEVRELADRLNTMADTPIRRQQISDELKKRFTFRSKRLVSRPVKKVPSDVKKKVARKR